MRIRTRGVASTRFPSLLTGVREWLPACLTLPDGVRVAGSGRSRTGANETQTEPETRRPSPCAGWEGWLYLATVIDCHTKEVIGWAADDNYKTPLIERAIEMAARNRPLAGKAIFHSDRGSNYTSASSPGHWRSMISGILPAAPASATTMPWPNRSSRR